MKWLILGALLGLLIAFPSLLALLGAIFAAIVSKPLLVAFGLGLAARPHLPRVRGWAP
jgi:hypothetical protein